MTDPGEDRAPGAVRQADAALDDERDADVLHGLPHDEIEAWPLGQQRRA